MSTKDFSCQARQDFPQALAISRPMPVERLTTSYTRNKSSTTIMTVIKSITKAFLFSLLLMTAHAAAGETPTQPSAVKQFNIVEWWTSIFFPRPPNINPTTQEASVPDTCPTCRCGHINGMERLVGGHETKVNQYPWIAMLLFRGSFYCAGSLISDLYVLTAARCLKGFPKEMMTVRLLAHSRIDGELSQIELKVVNTSIHEGYTTLTFDNDIGLIKLNERVEMSGIMTNVCMPQPEVDYADEEAVVIGWGATTESGNMAETLQEVRLPILSPQACRMSMYGFERITDNMLCAGLSDGGKDACQGDGGGPLLVRGVELNTFHLAGIVSWGKGCARPEYPGVYTRVNRYLTWIEEHSADSCKCKENDEKVK